MRTRSNDSCLLTETVRFLNCLDEGNDMSECDYKEVMAILKDALFWMIQPLLCPRLLSLTTPILTEYDKIAMVAFSVVLGEEDKPWKMPEEEHIKNLLDKIVALGYKDSEIWAFRFLSIRYIHSAIMWKYYSQKERYSDETIQADIGLVSLGNTFYCELMNSLPEGNALPYFQLACVLECKLHHAEASVYYHLYRFDIPRSIRLTDD